MIPEGALDEIQRWVDRRVSEHARDQVRLEVDVTDRTVTILECRPPWRPEYGPGWSRFPIARLRYTKSHNRWSLYWRDRNLKFHEYDLADPTPDIRELLHEIDRDPTSIFWGCASFERSANSQVTPEVTVMSGARPCMSAA